MKNEIKNHARFVLFGADYSDHSGVEVIMIEQGFTVLATILVMMGVFSLRDMYQKLRRENQALKAENQKTKEESAKL